LGKKILTEETFIIELEASLLIRLEGLFDAAVDITLDRLYPEHIIEVGNFHHESALVGRNLLEEVLGNHLQSPFLIDLVYHCFDKMSTKLCSKEELCMIFRGLEELAALLVDEGHLVLLGVVTNQLATVLFHHETESLNS